MPIAVNVEGLGRVNFPDDYTPDRIKFAIENDILPRVKKEAPPAEEPSMFDKVSRQVGLTVRAGVKGVSALPNMVLDPMVRGVNAVAGTNLPIPSEAQEREMTRVGVPEPANAAERVVQDVTAAMAGQGGIAKAAEMMKGLGPATFQRVMDLLSAEQKSQIIGAGGAAGGQGVAREKGVGPVGQTIAAVGGGLVAPTAVDATVQGGKAAYRGVKAAIDPFTKEGQGQVVGQSLRRMATNPDEAIANMDKAPEIVPGSTPTTAQAARDEGLLIAERGLASASPQAGARLSRRASEQNSARTILLNSMAGDEAALAKAEASRSTSTGKSREDAFTSATGPVDFAPVTDRLRAVAATPEGGRAESERALRWVGDRIEKYQAEGRTDPRNAYELQKDIGDLIAGKISDDKGAIRMAAGHANEIKKALTEQIELAAPGFKKYLADYSAQSKPINQMEMLQDLKAKVTNAGTDAASGENLLSAAKFSNALRNPDSREALKKTLTPDQFANLEAISADLDRGALSASSGKAAGSNTTQNLSTSYVLGQALGGKMADNAIARNIARPLSWLNKLNDVEIQQLMVDAMLDKGLAKTLMSKASPSKIESLGFELLQRARANGIGAGVEIGEARDRPSRESSR